MKVKITVGNHMIRATLCDNAAARQAYGNERGVFPVYGGKI